MDPATLRSLAPYAILGIGAGLLLLARGFIGYRTAGLISDTSTSRIASLAAGEVRISGTIQPAEATLVSLLQSQPCVYYRATVGTGEGVGIDPAFSRDGGFVEERSVGFRVIDDSGAIRVFPRGARVDAPVRFSGRRGALGAEPVGLSWRTGDAYREGQPDRATAIAELLTVRQPGRPPVSSTLPTDRAPTTYRETRLEPGDAVTILGTALPFGDLPDAAGADIGAGDDPTGADDPEIAADLDAARASGTLATDARSAWGNAAIEGFGIGQPVRTPTLDPSAHPLPIASPEAAARAARTFDIAPETLVLARTADGPLLVAYGTPGAAASRQQGVFLIGLLGAILAIGSAMVLALAFTAGPLR